MLSFLKRFVFGYLTFGFGPNLNMNLLRVSVLDLTQKQATDLDSRPNPKDSAKSTVCTVQNSGR